MDAQVVVEHEEASRIFVCELKLCQCQFQQVVFGFERIRNCDSIVSSYVFAVFCGS